MSCRDSQKSKFYNWLRTTQKIDIPIQSVHLYVNSIILNYGCDEPFYQYKNRNSTYNPKTKNIILDNRLEFISSHTVCCVASWYLKHMIAPNEVWHGETFCKIFADITAHLTNTPVNDVIKSMHSSKLKIAGYRPVGVRTLKRYEKLKNRVCELDAAINRGRYEFELFLQPILKELENSRLELSLLEEKILK